MTFLHKSHGKWKKVGKPVMVPTTYEDDDDNKVEPAPENHQNSN